MPPITRSRKRKASEDVFLQVVECLAAHKWLPWWGDEHPSLRLVSHAVKLTVDMEGPDFEAIVDLLNQRNGFNRESGACYYCSQHGFWGGQDMSNCQTCVRTKVDHVGDRVGACSCTKNHRFAPILWERDPRLNSQFTELPSREQAKRLLQFHRFCVSNFLQRFVLEDEEGDDKYNLTQVEPDEWVGNFSGDFGEQLRTYNRPIWNLIHNLLMIGANVNDLGFYEAKTTNPFEAFSPWRDTFLYGLGAERDDYDHEHDFVLGKYCEDHHDHMLHEFLQVHQPKEDEEIVVKYGDGDNEEEKGLTASQIQYIPKVLHECIVNSIDQWAVEDLGPRIAASIDLYAPARNSLYDISLKWMPCLGGTQEGYNSRESFEGYNPRMQHISYACGLDMFDHGLQQATRTD